jgi:periplasmic protein CpxP/Spy
MKEIVMTDIDHVPLLPEPPLRESAPGDDRKRSFPWRRSLALVGVLVGGLAIGAGSFAFAAGDDQSGWKQGLRLAIVQHLVAHALDAVGATAAQEAKAHDIIAAKFAEVAPESKQREAMRKQAVELLSAPTIDRAAVEKLRAEAVANFDAKSKAIVSGLLDIADVLTPPQRAQLSAQIEEIGKHMEEMGKHMEEMGRHGPMGGAHHGRWMDDEPSDGPDSGPDKD